MLASYQPTSHVRSMLVTCTNGHAGSALTWQEDGSYPVAVSDTLPAQMRVAAILGLGCSENDLKPFQRDSSAEWLLGLPAASSQVDAILVVGGDGTIHRHLAALVKLGLPLLVVPRGSGNDFARALGLHGWRDSLAAWNGFERGTGRVRTIDLGLITPLGHSESHGSDAAGCVATSYSLAASQRQAPEGQATYFCCVGGVGLDADVARRANRLPRWLRSRGEYALSLPAALMRFAPSIMTISMPRPDEQNGFTVRSATPTVLAAFANAPNFGGGMTIAPRAKMDDGQLDVCLVNDVNRFKLLCLFPSVYFGRHLGIANVEYFQAKRLRVQTERPLDVYADGEFVCRTPVEVSVEPQALRVIVQPS